MFQSSNYADGLEVRIAELTAERNDLREQLAAIDDPLDYAALAAELATENTDLRRQLAECQAKLADSIRIVERRRPGPLIADDDFDHQPTE